MSKFNYSLELFNDDGEYWALKEAFTKEQAIEQSKMYEDDSMPFGEPRIVYMCLDNPTHEDHYVETTADDITGVPYWKFEPTDLQIQ